MDKVANDVVSSLSHVINISERKNLVISGVKKIDSFDNEEFLLETSLGYIVVKGEKLEIIKLDTIQGNVSIKGYVTSLSYIDQAKQKTNENGIFSRLFQ